MKLKEIVSAYKSFNELINQNKLPFKLVWDIENILNELKIHFERYYKVHDNILRELGSEDENKPGFYIIEPSKIKEFESEIKELDEVDIKLNEFEKIPKESLFNDDIKITSLVEINSLKPFLK